MSPRRTKPAPKPPAKPRNVAAKALREGQYQPKVEANPKAYNRRSKHRPDLLKSEEMDAGEGQANEKPGGGTDSDGA